MQNKIIYIIGIIAVLISGAACVIGATYQPTTTKETVETYYSEPEAVTEAIIIRDETETTVNTETTTEPTTEPISEPKTYNTTLPMWMQSIVIAECGDVIAPEIVMAMIEKESNGNQYAIGDDGRSLGLMQIQPKYHINTMIRLNSTDLFNAQDNIRVGVEILKGLYERYGSIDAAVVAYNAGSYKGTMTNYGLSVMARAKVIGG